jgi:hypothetical protein
MAARIDTGISQYALKALSALGIGKRVGLL